MQVMSLISVSPVCNFKKAVGLRRFTVYFLGQTWIYRYEVSVTAVF